MEDMVIPTIGEPLLFNQMYQLILNDSFSLL